MTFLGKQNCDFNKPVVTMGTFDGVHLGHQKLIKKLVEKANRIGGIPLVITYYKHPLETIHKKTFPYILTENSLKEDILKNLGVECILYLNFTDEMAHMDPDEFIRKIIKDKLKARDLIVGYDTHFGCNRTGNYQYLNEHKKELDIEIEMVEPFRIDNRIVSSSLIRDFVREGSMDTVEKYLGRKYSLLGTVINGKKIGRSIGFPTINIRPEDVNKLIPAIGVYCNQVRIGNHYYQGVTNIGYSPTLKNAIHKEIETHILDFNDDLYGKDVELIFHKKLRDEIYYETKEALINRISQDVEETKEYFLKLNL